MSDTTIYLLLAGALLLPIIGAILLRLASRWMRTPLLYGASVLLVLAAAACALVLARNPTQSLRIGSLAVIQPVSFEPDGVHDGEEPGHEELAPTPTAASSTPAETASPVVTPTATEEPEPTATEEPEPTATEEPEPTATEEPEPTRPVAGQRFYTVESGDTVTSIAIRFDVTVEEIMEANDLSESDADNLQVGQTLIIP